MQREEDRAMIKMCCFEMSSVGAAFTFIRSYKYFTYADPGTFSGYQWRLPRYLEYGI
jgi:hypothetical protein